MSFMFLRNIFVFATLEQEHQGLVTSPSGVHFDSDNQEESQEADSQEDPVHFLLSS